MWIQNDIYNVVAMDIVEHIFEMKGIQEQSNTFHFKSHCKIHRIRRTAYPAVLPSHTIYLKVSRILFSVLLYLMILITI